MEACSALLFFSSFYLGIHPGSYSLVTPELRARTLLPLAHGAPSVTIMGLACYVGCLQLPIHATANSSFL